MFYIFLGWSKSLSEVKTRTRKLKTIGGNRIKLLSLSHNASINQSFYFCPNQHTWKINLTAVDKKKGDNGKAICVNACA